MYSTEQETKWLIWRREAKIIVGEGKDWGGCIAATALSQKLYPSSEKGGAQKKKKKERDHPRVKTDALLIEDSSGCKK